jgi:hypothetical protein
MTDPLFEGLDAPIEVYFGNPAFDLGIATVPKILPRFWTFLVSAGERLGEREFALLMQVLLLRESQDFELRLENVPMHSPESTLVRSLSTLRRMGLVFTERLYYPPRDGNPPTMRAQRWDLRSLFYNLGLIGQAWAACQREAVSTWEKTGRKGRRPVFNLAPDFTHEVLLPLDVAVDILKGLFFPVPDHWREAAQTLLAEMPTAHNMRGTDTDENLPTAQILRDRPPIAQDLRGTEGLPTAHEMRGTHPTAQILRGHLLEDEEDEEDETAKFAKKIFTYFARCKGDAGYHPAVKEQIALEKLIADGFSVEQIIAGIHEAFSRSNKPRHFTHCAAIIRDPMNPLRPARTQQEIPQPEARPPESQNAEALPEPEKIETPIVIEADFTRAVEVFRSAGREVTPDLLARFRLMAARCDAAARKAASTGPDWLADAITAGLGVAKSANLLNYADAVLNDWIANGRAGQVNKPARKPKPNPKGKTQSGVHDGIRDYLEQRGGVLDGE